MHLTPNSDKDWGQGVVQRQREEGDGGGLDHRQLPDRAAGEELSCRILPSRKTHQKEAGVGDEHGAQRERGVAVSK